MLNVLAAVALAALSFLLGLVGQGVVDYQLAKRHTIPRLRVLVNEDAAKLLDERLAAKPGVMANGVDPHDAAARRWEREAERKQRRAATELAIMSELVPRFGDMPVRGLWNFLRPEVRDAVLDAGENWHSLLAPMLTRLKPVSSEKESAPTFLPYGGDT